MSARYQPDSPKTAAVTADPQESRQIANNFGTRLRFRDASSELPTHVPTADARRIGKLRPVADFF
ncbi:MAG: hypothetical protein ACI8P0_001364 [Planctomycetaceae bacterium]|jgi:hypothetical protein